MAGPGVGRHDEGDRGQALLGEVAVELGQRAQVLLERPGHHRGRMRQRIADVAILVLVDATRHAPAAVPFPRHALGGERLGNGRRCLRRHGELVRPERLRLAGWRVAGPVIVHEIGMLGRAVAVVENAIGKRGQEIADRLDARLLRIGAGHIGAAAIAGLHVPIAGAGPRLGILDLVRRRRDRPAVVEIGGDVGGGEREVVGARPAHDRLVVIVGKRVALRQRAQIGRVAGSHVVEAHCHPALIRARARIVAVLGALARADGGPDEEVALPAIDLLPHLEEAVHGIADICQVIGVARDRERRVRQLPGEAPIAGKRRQAVRIGGVGLRQLGKAARGRRRHLVALPRRGPKLHGQRYIGPGAAIRGDDALGQQIGHGLPRWRAKRREEMVKRQVLADDDDDMLDRRGSAVGRRGSAGREQQRRQHRTGRKASFRLLRHEPHHNAFAPADPIARRARERRREPRPFLCRDQAARKLRQPHFRRHSAPARTSA